MLWNEFHALGTGREMCYNTIMKKVTLCAVATAGALESAEEILAKMPAPRRERYEAVNNPETRAQLLAAAAALNGALGEPPAEFFYYPDGRPGVPGAWVSIAHTKGMAVCAVCGAEVGVDIE